MKKTELSAVTRQVSAVSCQLVAVLIWVAVPGCRTGSAGGAGGGSQDRVALSHALPRLDGDHLAVKLVEVTYPPGGASRPHSHPCPVAVYVIDGALRVQVKGEPETVYRAGETFYEAPKSAHLVSANASDKEPARFVAFFVCDKDTPLSVPLSDSASAPGKEP